MGNKTLYLVDGTSICYRSYFAIKLSNAKSFPTGAVYGFYQTIKKINTHFKPQLLGMCFDVGRKTFRHERYKEYKLQRPETPDALKVQIPVVKKLVTYLGIPLVEKEGFEADDIIASLCQQARSKGYRVVIVSSDKDMYQLLENDNVVTYNPHQDVEITHASFEKEFGFPPNRITDYLALAGDSADNIPGAHGIGKVGATKLIQEYATVENIFNNLAGITDKTREILIKEKESIMLSKELATLAPDSFPTDIDTLCVKEPQSSELYALFRELEFKAFLKDLPAPALTHAVTVVEGLPKSFTDSAREVALYTDSTHVYVYDPSQRCMYREDLHKAHDFLVDESIKKISFDFKEQLFANASHTIEPFYFDIQIAAYLLDSSLSDYTLSHLVTNYLGELCHEVPVAVAAYYIHKLYFLLSAKLREQGLEGLFFKVEMPLCALLLAMQRIGVAVDSATLETVLKEVEIALSKCSQEIFSSAGRTFNINSPQQLSTILFDELKITPLKKTKTGYSTGEEVLHKLALNFPIARFVLEYRELNKLKTTYLVPLITDVKVHKGRLHAHFNQVAAATGRLSSSQPNLQSIPVKGKFSLPLRRAFVASDTSAGCLIAADYSQIELRILAHYSQDEHLLEAFKSNKDVHRLTASLLFGVKESEVTESQRDVAKRINFSVLYGMGAYGLSQELAITPYEAQRFIDEYFLRYAEVKNYIERVFVELKEKGYVTTVLGRKRYLPDFNSANIQMREFARRQAVNAPIQGTCADLIKVAMVAIFKEFKEKKLQSKMIIQIHDELIFDVPNAEVATVIPIIKQHMEQALTLDVPIRVDIKVGKNWADMEEYVFK